MKKHVVWSGASLLAVVLGLAALRQSEVPPPDGTVTLEPSQALRDLDRMLAAHTVFDLETAWAVVRALGKRAPEAAKQKLRQALEADGIPEAPSWAGEEPKIAIATTLLETRLASDPASLCVHVETASSGDDAGALGLSWGIEYLALCAREGNPKTDRKRMGSLMQAGIKALERRTDPSSLQYARLAQSLFRAAPLVLDSSQALELRRVHGRLAAVWTDAASVDVEGARLEAAASFALLSVASGGDLDPNLAASLRAAEARLTRRVGPALTAAEQCAAFRGLRWGRVALEKTAPSGSASGIGQSRAP